MTTAAPDGTAISNLAPPPPTPTVRRWSRALPKAFGALQVRNFRLYVVGQSVASTGTWMQSVTQDWLVLELSHSATAVGITMALQFLPMLLFGMYGGVLADRFPKRRILLATQATNAVLTAGLAVLTITGRVQVVHVYEFALLAGLVFAVDNPARQVFVNELVPPHLLRNAIGLNSATFQCARLVGPAVAGVLIGTVGSGWAFAANSVCYLGPTVMLLLIRSADLRRTVALPRASHQVRDALAYLSGVPHVRWTIVLVGVVGTFGLNFPVVLTAMAHDTFHGSASLYGLFNVALAIGSISGALFAGSRARASLRFVAVLAAAFGLSQAATALAPDVATFVFGLVVMGAANLAFQALANSSVQLWVEPALRGRVMGLYMLAFTGGTPLGGPLIGLLTARYGPRLGMIVCGAVPLAAAAVLLVAFGRPARAQVRPVQPEAHSVQAKAALHGANLVGEAGLHLG